ncbi:MAG: hypothetical protein AAFQ82_27320, partial [Myxococcota bacterium]
MLQARATDFSQNVTVTETSVTVTSIRADEENSGEGGNSGPSLFVDEPRSYDAVGPGFELRYQGFGMMGASSVRLWRDGAPQQDLPVLEPVEVSPGFTQGLAGVWVDAAEWSEGLHLLELVAQDSAGRIFASDPFYVVRESAPELPRPSIVSPHPAAGPVTGTVEFLLAAVGREPVSELVLYSDGTEIGRASESPARLIWDSTQNDDGCQVFVAEARDLLGRSGFSEPRTLCVDNTGPELTLSTPREGAVVGVGVVPIRVQTDQFDLRDFTVQVDGIENTTANSATSLFARLNPGLHRVRVIARDQVGLIGQSPEVEVMAQSCATETDCDDGDPCTTDACAANGWCTYARETACCVTDSDCTDSDPCTRETCS